MEFDDLELALEHHRRNRAPQDVVPPKSLTREQILDLNNAVGEQLQVIEPPQLTLDVDGIPNALGDYTTSRVPVAAVMLTRAQLKAAGVMPEEVPNAHIVN